MPLHLANSQLLKPEHYILSRSSFQRGTDRQTLLPKSQEGRTFVRFSNTACQYDPISSEVRITSKSDFSIRAESERVVNSDGEDYPSHAINHAGYATDELLHSLSKLCKFQKRTEKNKGVWAEPQTI